MVHNSYEPCCNDPVFSPQRIYRDPPHIRTAETRHRLATTKPPKEEIGVKETISLSLRGFVASRPKDGEEGLREETPKFRPDVLRIKQALAHLPAYKHPGSGSGRPNLTDAQIVVRTDRKKKCHREQRRECAHRKRSSHRQPEKYEKSRRKPVPSPGGLKEAMFSSLLFGGHRVITVHAVKILTRVGTPRTLSRYEGLRLRPRATITNT